MSINWPAKDSDEVLDYQVNWTSVAASDPIVSSTVAFEISAGCTIQSTTNTATAVTIWISGGVSGQTAAVRNQITTAAGRTYEEIIFLPIVGQPDTSEFVGPGELTTLQAVKAWLGLTVSLTPAQTNQIQRLIRSASIFLLNQMGRASFSPTTLTEVYDGGGNPFMVPRQWPIVGIISIETGGVTITDLAIGNPRANGYYLEPPPPGGAAQRINLYGHYFPIGRGNVTLTYRVGYVTSAAMTVPSFAPYTLTTPELWAEDEGVTLADGTALTKVSAAPMAGQYSVSGGVYTFNAAQVGALVVISYAYIPADIVQAATELVGERFKAKDRIGVNSQSLAGKESITYYQRSDMSSWMKSAIQPYKRVI